MKITKSEIRAFRALSQKKVRQEQHRFVLEGWRAVKEVLNSHTKLHLVAVLPRYLEDSDYRRILDAIEEKGVPVKEVNDQELSQIAETVHAQGIVAIAEQRSLSLDQLRLERTSLVVAVDAVSDPGNLGSIVRSADWFDADLLVLGKGCVELHNEKVVRSTVGSILHLPVIEGADLTTALKKFKLAGFSIVALSADGKLNYADRPADEKSVIVFGNEAHGISSEVRKAVDAVVRIPKYGKAESLNVGVACGIMLAHIRELRGKKGR